MAPVPSTGAFVPSTLQHTPGESLKLGDVTATELEIDPKAARYDVHLCLRDEEGGLGGYIVELGLEQAAAVKMA